MKIFKLKQTIQEYEDKITQLNIDLSNILCETTSIERKGSQAMIALKISEDALKTNLNDLKKVEDKIIAVNSEKKQSLQEIKEGITVLAKINGEIEYKSEYLIKIDSDIKEEKMKEESLLESNKSLEEKNKSAVKTLNGNIKEWMNLKELSIELKLYIKKEEERISNKLKDLNKDIKGFEDEKARVRKIEMNINNYKGLLNKKALEIKQQLKK